MEATKNMARRTLSSFVWMPSSARHVSKVFVRDIYQVFVKPKDELLLQPSSNRKKGGGEQHIVDFFNLSPHLMDVLSLMQECLICNSRQAAQKTV